MKILITDGMAQSGLDILKEISDFEVDVRKSTPADELAKIIGGYDAIVIRSATKLTKDLIDKATAMKLIVRAGAGVDNIDVPRATEKKIPVMNTASANSLAAAEQTIALMFSMLRMIPQSMITLREGKWDRASFKGREATGKILGVVGLGNIGRIVCEKAVGLGMKVIGYDPGTKTAPPPGVQLVSDMEEVFSKADILSVHVPKIPETKKLVNSDRIATMKDGSFIINCARGGIVDETAVLKALDAGKLNGAAFDVYENEPPDFSNPLFKHPKAVCVPHLGASTFEAQGRVAVTASSQMIGFFKKGDRTGVINSL